LNLSVIIYINTIVKILLKEILKHTKQYLENDIIEWIKKI
jgi:hypothetical protein